MIKLYKHQYSGTITPPSSKSDGHRALIAAALVRNGISKITNLNFSNDIKATISSLESLGAKFTYINEDTLLVKGISNTKTEVILDCQESGSTLRLLLPIANHFSNQVKFLTKGNLINRPLSVYECFYDIKKEESQIISTGKFKSGVYMIDGSLSSQFISGLLFVLPLLKEDTTIIINNKIASLQYILMTIDTLKKFNIDVFFDIKNQTILVKGNQEYQSCEYHIENDYSQASYFLALGALSNNPITVKGLNLNSLQADKNILSIFQKMGIDIEINENEITTKKSLIKGTTISLDENIDLGPILIGLASFSTEPITFTNISRLKDKESNRLLAMKYNLEKLGAKLEIIDDNTCTIYPSKLKETNETLSSFNDHRIFMTLAIICHNIDITIDNYTCINKSYPTFLNDLNSLIIKN